MREGGGGGEERSGGWEGERVGELLVTSQIYTTATSYSVKNLLESMKHNTLLNSKHAFLT